MPKYSKGKILVLGGSGTAGSAIAREAHEQGYEVSWTTTSRREINPCKGVRYRFLAEELTTSRHLASIIKKSKPDFIVNALMGRGSRTYWVNTVIPQLLAQFGIPVIHLSTNAVFKARKEPYSENEKASPQETDYSMSKYLGEVPSQLNLRVSFIGVPVWTPFPAGFFLEKYNVRHETAWNGVTNVVLARFVIQHAVENYAKLHTKPAVHLCSQPEKWSDVVSWWRALRSGPLPLRTLVSAPRKLPLLLSGFTVSPFLQEQIRELGQPFEKKQLGFYELTSRNS